MSIKLMIGMVFILFPIISVWLPDSIIDTESCKKNWSVVLTILTGAAMVTDYDELAFLFSSILISGILTNYFFPVLLNVLSTFNRKSDP
jgi:hypothetical protein